MLRSGESYFTTLIIKDAHEHVLHHGIESTLAYIRTNFWIMKGRKTVKDLLRKCVLCKRFQGKTMLPPASPDIPDFRVNHLLNAFEATGLDFAGPLFIKKDTRDSLKVYILLLTCASSRAIHLELVPDMKVPAFLRGFSRFSARRGIPSFIVHDNFKTFRSVEVKKYMLKRGVKQRFILPASPWWGGFYERLVRTVKTALKKVLGKSLLTFEELQTILCDIESTINSRPLTYTNEDDLDEIITPNHLIYGRNINTKMSSDVSYNDYSRRAKHIQTLLAHFWKRFKSEYLNELRQRELYLKAKSSNKPLIVGDVVIIRDDLHTPRSQWRMGKVEELVVGKDGSTRGAKLRVISKQGKRTTAYRPLQKLIPFEIVTDDTIPTPNIEIDTSEHLEQHGEMHRCVSSRPHR